MSDLQASIATKLGDYPSRLEKDTHHASAIVPTKIASILQQDPQLIAAAVRSFHHRDPDDLKAARNMANFPPDAVSPPKHYFL